LDAPPSELTLHLERSLHVPASLVYEACTEPDLLAEWWGPNGFTTPGIEIDLRVGGRYRIAMQPPEGELFYLSGEFLEVDPPTRLAYTFRWEDPTPTIRRRSSRSRCGTPGNPWSSSSIKARFHRSTT
jgi:uncharacterized protein YndB with AHSA1/START domain